MNPANCTFAHSQTNVDRFCWHFWQLFFVLWKTKLVPSLTGQGERDASRNPSMQSLFTTHAHHNALFSILTRVLTIATSGSSGGLFGWRSGDLLIGGLGYLFTPCLATFLHTRVCSLTRGFWECGLVFFSRGFWSGWLTGLWAGLAVIPLYWAQRSRAP